jgi:hypothetical protein
MHAGYSPGKKRAAVPKMRLTGERGGALYKSRRGHELPCLC